jgi:outer membrane protein assembly factor BamB
MRSKVRCGSIVFCSILALAGFCFSQSAPSASSELLTNWSEFHRPAMKRWNPYENVLNVNNVGGLKLIWRYNTGGAVNSSPAIVNGVVYVGSGYFKTGRVYALRAATGAKLWSHKLGSSVLSSPAVANGIVYVGSGPPPNNKVYALKAHTGALLWSYDTSFVYPSPSVVNNMVYIGSNDGIV